MPMPFNLSVKIACSWKAHTSQSPSQIRTDNLSHFTDVSGSEVTAQYHTESVEDPDLEPRSLNSLISCYIHGGQPIL